MVVVKLDKKGIAQILKSSQMAATMNAAAAAVAATAESQTDAPVETRSYTFDRRAASVAIASERGETEEAVDGVLTRSAAAAGLDVATR